MHVALFGGTGATGMFVLKELLERRHTVHVLVRNPDNLSEYVSHESLKIVQGDAENRTAVFAVIRDTQAVVSTLGHKNSSSRLQELSTLHIIEAMKKGNLKRLVCLTGAGAFMEGDNPGLMDIFTRKMIQFIDPERLRDGIRMCDLISKSGLDWTIVRTNMQLNRINSGALKIGSLGDPNITLFVSRNLIARFIVDRVEGHAYINQSPVISN
jgi:putative NADH-flavin reductase